MRSRLTVAAVAGILSLSFLWSGGVPAAEPREEMSREDLQAHMAAADAPLVLDVRTPEEYAAGHIPGAVNISHEQVAGRLEELLPYREREIVLYCKSGRRAGIVADTLAQAGFGRLRHLAGDMPGWSAAGLPVESGPGAALP